MRKLTALVTSVALVATMTSIPANAAVTVLDTVTPDDASAETLGAMQDQCDALADAHVGDWTGEVDLGSISPSYVSGPTEVGTHSIDDAIGDPVGAGTFTPAHVEVLGNPYRVGGSVNMFGVLQSVGGRYSASQYDFYGDFESTYAYAFNCTMTETVQTPATGAHFWQGVPGSEEDQQNACVAITATGNFVGEDVGQCIWVELTPPGEEEEARPDEAGIPVNQTQTDNLLAHEDFGEGFDTDETLLIGQAVICISPKKPTPGGTWQTHNGYTGSNCNTNYFNSAPWGAGSQDSNGTYISVPLV